MSTPDLPETVGFVPTADQAAIATMTTATAELGTDPAQPAPSHIDPTVHRASMGVGGPWGRYAVQQGWWTAARWLLLLASITLILAFAQKSPCANGEWRSNIQYTHACYSDVIPLWNTERFDVGAVPYRDQVNEYPVLTGGFMWVAANITYGLQHVITNESPAAIFGMLTSFMLALCALVAVFATSRAAGRRPYDAAIFALSPLLMFQAYTNWDLFAIMLTSCALWAWSRKQPVIFGVFIGLGTAAKLYPALLLIPIVVLALRTRRVREAGWAIGSALAMWLAVNLPIAVAYNTGWRGFFQFNFERSTEADTLWYIVHHLIVSGVDPTYQDWKPPGALVAIVVLAGLAAVAALGVMASRKPRLAQLAFLVVAVFLLTSKIWSRQYSLWLLPLLALARPRWRSALLWQFSEIGVWIVFLLWLMGTTNKGPDYGMLMTVVLIRDVAVLIVCGLIVYDILRPQADVVRQHGLDDPGGGVFDRAHDYWAGRFQRRPILEWNEAEEAEEHSLSEEPA